MIVISEIGIKDIGSFQPIRTAEGNNTKKAIRIPLIIELIFKSTVEFRNPTTVHIVNAEILASQVKF